MHHMDAVFRKGRVVGSTMPSPVPARERETLSVPSTDRAPALVPRLVRPLLIVLAPIALAATIAACGEILDFARGERGG